MSTILKYGDVLRIDYISITDWTCVADGTEFDIGIELRIGRGNIFLSYTPDTNTRPDTYTQNVYTSGNIFITTKKQAIWIKPIHPNLPVSVSGETVYNVPVVPVPPPVPPITYGLPWRLN